MKLVIYGAQGYALGAYEAIKNLCPSCKIPFFMVTQIGNNASNLGGIPVLEIGSVSSDLSDEEKKQLEILIATPDNIQTEIEKTLENYGFIRHIRLNSERWGELMKLFHIKMGRFFPIAALPLGFSKPRPEIYMATSHKDIPLNNTPVLPDYIFPLQVGAANTDVKKAFFTDNTGDNISEKNTVFSELTGLYWIWKNKLYTTDTSQEEEKQYVGLVQYRRMLMFSEDDLSRLQDNDVDAVLPYPLPYEPNIHEHHKRYINDDDWDFLLTALQELQPEYAGCFPEILNQKYFYNYNVILAKKTILREYCEWLFPILMRTVELSSYKGDRRSDRYIGYMGETLETLYFIKNAHRLNLVHTMCKIYM